MKKIKVLSALVLVLVVVLATSGYVWATPSQGFSEKNGDRFDNW